MPTTDRLLEEADRLLTEYLAKISWCVGLLDDDGLWWRANRRSNSVGNVVLHLCGNLSQWVLAGLGGLAYERRRGEEFAARGEPKREELLRRLDEVVARCRDVIAGLDEARMARRVVIQGYEGDGIRVLLHAVEHMAYHTGQIVLLAKQLVPERVAIEFYPHLDESPRSDG